MTRLWSVCGHKVLYKHSIELCYALSTALACVAVDGGGKRIARLLDEKRLTQRVSCTICGDLDSVDEQSLHK